MHSSDVYVCVYIYIYIYIRIYTNATRIDTFIYVYTCIHKHLKYCSLPVLYRYFEKLRYFAI
jgi:hypothetical protein